MNQLLTFRDENLEHRAVRPAFDKSLARIRRHKHAYTKAEQGKRNKHKTIYPLVENENPSIEIIFNANFLVKKAVNIC